MQVFQELTVRGTPEQIAATAEGICALVTEPWSRNAQLEAGLKSEHGVSARCFERAEGNNLRAAILLLGADQPTVLAVRNIVTKNSPELNYSQYNALLNEFTNLFVRPAATETGTTVELTPADVDIDYWLHPDAARKLRAFSESASRWTGSSNPTDRKLWFDFVIAASRTKSALNAATLARWLCEVGGWSKELADELSTQYRREREVLEYAESLAIGA